MNGRKFSWLSLGLFHPEISGVSYNPTYNWFLGPSCIIQLQSLFFAQVLRTSSWCGGLNYPTWRIMSQTWKHSSSCSTRRNENQQFILKTSPRKNGTLDDYKWYRWFTKSCHQLPEMEESWTLFTIIFFGVGVFPYTKAVSTQLT